MLKWKRVQFFFWLTLYVLWNWWTLAMALPWWQHHKHCPDMQSARGLELSIIASSCSMSQAESAMWGDEMYDSVRCTLHTTHSSVARHSQRSVGDDAPSPAISAPSASYQYFIMAPATDVGKQTIQAWHELTLFNLHVTERNSDQFSVKLLVKL